MLDSFHEKCGIFGVYGKGLHAARLTYFGLSSLQHRGQESSGIAASDGIKIKTHKGPGLVAQVYTEKHLQNLKGYLAIGHNRYSTSGGSFSKHAQPIATTNDIVSLAHNGNLPETKKLNRFLAARGVSMKGTNDSGRMYLAIKYYLRQGLSLQEAITQVYPLFTGAFSLLVMTRNEIAAVRDQYGIRPLSIGRLDQGYLISSETCAIDSLNGTFLREVRPGELVILNEKGISSTQLAKPNQKLDIFEFIYFSRPDSMLLGKWVHEVRKNLGRELAKENPLKADVVIPVPDSAIPAAIGYAEALHIPIDFGLVKNRYIGRTFIMPDQKLRDKSVEMKLNPIRQVLEKKRVVIIDDSIVRGTTAKKLVAMVRKAGARKVHLLSSCPPVRFPDFYGIDTPTQHELMASHMTTTQIKDYVKADSVYYLSYSGLINATGLAEKVFCTSQFTGYYPIDIGKNMKEISYIFKDAKRKTQIAILVSDRGTGSNLQAIIKTIAHKKLYAKVAVVVCDSEDAPGITVAKEHNINTVTCKSNPELLELLTKHYDLDFVLLAGWGKTISTEIIHAFPNKILDVHPGLVPQKGNGLVKNPDNTPALHNRGKLTNAAIRNFLSHKATYAGSSVHFVTEELDTGPVLARVFEKIKRNDTIESLYERLKQKENKMYVEVLEKLVEGKGL